MLFSAHAAGRGREPLAWRAGPYKIEVLKSYGWVQRIAEDERERIARLRAVIDAHDIEARTMQAHPGTASTTE